MAPGTPRSKQGGRPGLSSMTTGAWLCGFCPLPIYFSHSFLYLNLLSRMFYLHLVSNVTGVRNARSSFREKAFPPLSQVRGKDDQSPGKEMNLLVILELHCLLCITTMTNPTVTSNDK